MSRDVVELRVTSPCVHGVRHEFLALPRGVVFSTRACVDSRGNPRGHLVTAEDYPTVVRMR